MRAEHLLIEVEPGSSGKFSAVSGGGEMSLAFRLAKMIGLSSVWGSAFLGSG